MNPLERENPKGSYPWLGLLLLAVVAVVVQGYHFGTDDAEIYIPAIKKVFNPHLYPFGSEFFLKHAGLSLFAPVVGLSGRLLHLPIDLVVLLWYLACVYCLLIAGWQIACAMFRTMRARWGAVALLAMLLPVPVAGVALVLADPYLTARSFSTPLVLLALGSFLNRRMAMTVLWLALAAAFHPQMAVYAVAVLVILTILRRLPSSFGTSEEEYKSAISTTEVIVLAVLPARFPGGFSFHPVSSPYREILYTRTYFFAQMWHWYEWLGIIFPLVIIWLFTRVRPAITKPAFQQIGRALLFLGLLATAAFLSISFSSHLESFARIQPMRSFHLIYAMFFLMLGGLIGDHLLEGRIWRWAVLFVPLAIGMYLLDRSDYSYSRHIEWPMQTPEDPWAAAFVWIRNNTPVNAVFALNPNYMAISGEDQHGFRAIAERSALADNYKDSGAVTMFPQLLGSWESQQKLQRGWTSFKDTDFEHLIQVSPVTWVVVERTLMGNLNCPYQNSAVAVCFLSSIFNANWSVEDPARSCISFHKVIPELDSMLRRFRER